MELSMAYHCIDEIAVVDWNNTLRTNTHGTVIVESLRQFLLDRENIFLVQICTNQTHSAVNIITHTSYN